MHHAPLLCCSLLCHALTCQVTLAHPSQLNAPLRRELTCQVTLAHPSQLNAPLLCRIALVRHTGVQILISRLDG